MTKYDSRLPDLQSGAIPLAAAALVTIVASCGEPPATERDDSAPDTNEDACLVTSLFGLASPRHQVIRVTDRTVLNRRPTRFS